MVDRAAVSKWLDAYVSAWETYDADAIGALFSDDAVYAWHPWDTEPARGRDAIVKAWLDDKDKPGRYNAHYAPLAIDGDLAIATGKSTYYTRTGAVKREYWNCFVLRFDSDGRCTSFTEWFMRQPAGI